MHIRRIQVNVLILFVVFVALVITHQLPLYWYVIMYTQNASNEVGSVNLNLTDIAEF